MTTETEFVKIGDRYFKVNSVSYIGKPDKHINYANGGNITYFFPIIIGGQKTEITSPDEEGLTKMRELLVDVVVPGRTV